MAYGIVQSAVYGANSGTTAAITPTSNLGAGNLLIAFIGRNSSPIGTPPTIAASGLTWTTQLNFLEAFNGQRFLVWTAPVAGTAGTQPVVTVTSAADWINWTLIELSGVDTSTTPFSTSATNSTNNSSTATAGPTGTSGANELGIFFVGMTVPNAVTTDTGSGFTEIVNGGVQIVCASYKTVNNATFTGTAGLPSQGTYGAAAVVIKLSAGVTAGPSVTASYRKFPKWRLRYS